MDPELKALLVGVLQNRPVSDKEPDRRTYDRETEYASRTSSDVERKLLREQTNLPIPGSE